MSATTEHYINFAREQYMNWFPSFFTWCYIYIYIYIYMCVCVCMYWSTGQHSHAFSWINLKEKMTIHYTSKIVKDKDFYSVKFRAKNMILFQQMLLSYYKLIYNYFSVAFPFFFFFWNVHTMSFMFWLLHFAWKWQQHLGFIYLFLFYFFN